MLKVWLAYLDARNLLPANFPKKLVVELTDIIISHNYFKFGDTDWIQEMGTAMGTPMACVYASISLCD